MSLIDKNAAMPIYEQIYEAYKKQILSGAIEPGVRLPATRKLAVDLAIGRNTVDNAYQQLVMEGYVTAKAGAGYIVNDLSLTHGFWPEKAQTVPHKPAAARPKVRYDFGSGRAATSLFPVKAWKRCLIDNIDERAFRHAFMYPELQGEYPLRKAIRNYLFSARGIDCQAENIVITSGLEYSIERLMGLFAGQHPVVAIENPGYHSARQAFLLQGCSLCSIPLDHDGVNLDAVRRSGAKFLYITPSHQFPTGAVLPIKKRLETIEWARANDSYIIEDDYDSELRYNAKPSPTLYSSDRHNHTVYMGTFSKSLSPSLRMAFMVLPDPLMEAFHRQYKDLHNSAPTSMQLALARFISEGHYSRHIDRLRVSNKKKNSILIASLHRVFGAKATVTGAGAGQHILVDIDSPLTEHALLETANAAGIRLHAASKYWMDAADAQPHQIMMGYGGIAPEDIGPAIEALYDIWFPAGR